MKIPREEEEEEEIVGDNKNCYFFNHFSISQ